MVAASSENEIQSAYGGREKAAGYVEQRFSFPLMEMLHRRQVAAVNNVMQQARPLRTLEVAPGPGRMTREVRPAGELVCLEYNEGMIAEGRATCNSQVRWVEGNAFELPFEQEFNFLYSFRFVRHFHREDRERLYGEFRKVLSPGGWLVLDAVNAAVSEPLRLARPDDYPIYDKLYRDETELREELQLNGFEVMRLEPVQRAFRWQCLAQVLLGPRSTTLCRWTIQALEQVSWAKSLEWIVTCRRKS